MFVGTTVRGRFDMWRRVKPGFKQAHAGNNGLPPELFPQAFAGACLHLDISLPNMVIRADPQPRKFALRSRAPGPRACADRPEWAISKTNRIESSCS
jgi:hypothetical protein